MDITNAEIIAFAVVWENEMYDIQYAIDLGQPAPCVDCCANLAEAKITHGHCGCECDDVETHCRQQREAEAYWSGYFGRTNADGTTRPILQSGFTVWVEDGETASGLRPKYIGDRD